MHLYLIIVDENNLHLCIRVRWRVSVPLETIITIRPLTLAERQKKEVLDLSIAGNAKLLLELNEPLTVRRLFGVKRVTNKIAFAVDDEKAFLSALEH